MSQNEKNKQNTNLILDILLFTGFILCFFMDLTGMSLHQWLGVVLCGAAVIHLLLHDSWVKNVLRRFSDLRTRPQILFLLDVAVAFGFVGVLVTGLIISTWLNLPLTSISVWISIHTAFSIETLFFLLVKVGFHWRWISCAIRILFAKKPVPQTAVLNPSLAPALQPARKQISRRDFLAVMGVAGVASYLAVHSLLKEDQLVASAQSVVETATATAAPPSEATTAQSTSVVTPTATTAPTATRVPTHQPAYACTVLCREGCSFPGRCRRYVDTNGNNLCDNGECL